MSGTKSSSRTLAVLFTLAASSSVVYQTIPSVQAQSTKPNPSFSFPKEVKDGTTVRINGSSSMAKINEALAQRFKTQFSGTNFKVNYDGSSAALKAVLDGKADIASIGRPLTDAEKAKGLVAVPVSRNKIAMFVRKDNPFNKSLTINQFAQMFRGQITNWSKVGGGNFQLRLVDRPDGSDTRQAFQNYPVFKSAPFKTGANAVKLKDDSTDAVIKTLGKNGIGYAIADQVVKNPDVRVLAMHDVAPSDARYPFSQPLNYVYKGPNPNPAAKAFLGYATAPKNEQVVEAARVENAKATTSGATVVAPQNASNATASSTESTKQSAATKEAQISQKTAKNPAGNFIDSNENTGATPWWWLLPALGGGLALGGLGMLLKQGRSATKTAVTPAVVPPTSVAAPPTAFVPPVAESVPATRMILTPRDSQSAYAYWEIDPQVKQNMKQMGGRNLKLRLYDVTDIDLNYNPPHSAQEFDCDENEQDLHIPIALDDRDYMAELGYVTPSGEWLEIAGTKESVRVPARSSQGTQFNIPMAVAGAAGAAAAGTALVNSFTDDTHDIPENYSVDKGRVILVPQGNNEAYAYWEIPDERTEELQRRGGRLLGMKVYDSTGGMNLDEELALPVQQYDCNSSSDLHIKGLEGGRDYVAELGYITEQGDWLKVARSEQIRVSQTSRTTSTNQSTNDDVTTSTIIDRVEFASDVDNALDASDSLKVEESLANASSIIGGAAVGGAIAASMASTSTPVDEPALDEASAEQSIANFSTSIDGTVVEDSETDTPTPSNDTTNTKSHGAYRSPLEAIKNAASSFADNISNKISNVASDTAKGASNLVDNATQKASTSVENTKNAAKNIAFDVTNKAADVVDSTSASTSDLVENTTQKTSDLMGEVKKSVGAVFVGGVGAVAGAGAAARNLLDNKATSKADSGNSSVPKRVCRIILTPLNPHDAYAYWEVSDDYKAIAREQGGTRLMLRVHDATNLDIDYYPPHATYEYPVAETQQDKHVSIPNGDRDYIAELGYYTDENRWVRIIRSFHVHI